MYINHNLTDIHVLQTSFIDVTAKTYYLRWRLHYLDAILIRVQTCMITTPFILVFKHERFTLRFFTISSYMLHCWHQVNNEIWLHITLTSAIWSNNKTTNWVCDEPCTDTTAGQKHKQWECIKATITRYDVMQCTITITNVYNNRQHSYRCC